MKKTLAMLAAVMLCAICASAITPAELTGYKWKSKKVDMPSPDDAVKAYSVVEYAFDSESTYSEKEEMVLNIFDKESKMKIDIYMTITSTGAYTAEGDSITLTTDVSTLKVVCEDEDIHVTFPGGESNAIMESMVKGQMRQMVDYMRQVAEEGFQKPTVLQNVKINGKKATAETEKITLEFSIKKI